MILSELMSFIREKRRVSLDEIALRLDTDQSAARSMLELLTEKGRIRKVPGAACGKQCGSCNCGVYQSGLWEIAPLNHMRDSR